MNEQDHPLDQPECEGKVAITENGQRYEVRYECEHDNVTIYIGHLEPFTTQSGGLYPQTVARLYLREFLDGRLVSNAVTFPLT
jgi:hypothetical protein